jgi:hypothetical protein
MIRTILARAVRVLRDGGVLPSVPTALASVARGEPIALHDYLELDDGVLWGAMHAWETARDHPLADLAKRVRARALFKTLELFGDQAAGEGAARSLAIARDVASTRGYDPDAYVGLDLATDEPFANAESPLMVAYARGPARPLHEVSFLLGRLAGQTLTRVRLVLAPELREPVTHALGL